jgi:hypothetical protein
MGERSVKEKINGNFDKGDWLRREVIKFLSEVELPWHWRM